MMLLKGYFIDSATTHCMLHDVTGYTFRPKLAKPALNY